MGGRSSEVEEGKRSIVQSSHLVYNNIVKNFKKGGGWRFGNWLESRAAFTIHGNFGNCFWG